MACEFLSLSCWCVIYVINLTEQRYVCEWGRDGVMFMYAHAYDMALCCNTVWNAALGLWLVAQSLVYTLWTTLCLSQWQSVVLVTAYISSSQPRVHAPPGVHDFCVYEMKAFSITSKNVAEPTDHKIKNAKKWEVLMFPQKVPQSQKWREVLSCGNSQLDSNWSWSPWLTPLISVAYSAVNRSETN